MFVPTKPVCCGGARYLVGIIGDDGFARPLLGAEIKEVCRLLNAKPALGERSEPALPLLGEAASEEAARDGWTGYDEILSITAAANINLQLNPPDIDMVKANIHKIAELALAAVGG